MFRDGDICFRRGTCFKGKALASIHHTKHVQYIPVVAACQKIEFGVIQLDVSACLSARFRYPASGSCSMELN